MSRPDAPETVTALWASHHYPSDYDRCVVWRRHHLCRRCLVLYPLAFAVMVVTLAQARRPDAATAAALVALPLPAVADFVAEHVGMIRYSAIRQVVVTVPLAVALGAGLARYLRHPGDVLFWAVALIYGGACGAAAVLGDRRR